MKVAKHPAHPGAGQPPGVVWPELSSGAGRLHDQGPLQLRWGQLEAQRHSPSLVTGQQVQLPHPSIRPSQVQLTVQLHSLNWSLQQKRGQAQVVLLPRHLEVEPWWPFSTPLVAGTSWSCTSSTTRTRPRRRATPSTPPAPTPPPPPASPQGLP